MICAQMILNPYLHHCTVPDRRRSGSVGSNLSLYKVSHDSVLIEQNGRSNKGVALKQEKSVRGNSL